VATSGAAPRSWCWHGTTALAAAMFPVASGQLVIAHTGWGGHALEPQVTVCGWPLSSAWASVIMSVMIWAAGRMS
jgi:hypothetical protein